MDPLMIALIVAIFTLIVLFSGIPIAFGLSFVLKSYLEDLDCLGNSVPNMMFTEAESLALFTLILVCKVLLLVEELALLD